MCPAFYAVPAVLSTSRAALYDGNSTIGINKSRPASSVDLWRSMATSHSNNVVPPVIRYNIDRISFYTHQPNLKRMYIAVF